MSNKRVRTKLQVIKVPLAYTPEIKIPNFPPMPRLYMELLENKEKVKPELRTKEYLPKNINNINQIPSLNEAEKQIINNPNSSISLDTSQDNDQISVVTKNDFLKKKKNPLQILDLSSMSTDEIDNLNLKKNKDVKEEQKDSRTYDFYQKFSKNDIDDKKRDSIKENFSLDNKQDNKQDKNDMFNNRYENKYNTKYTSDKYDRYENKNEDKYTSDKYDKYGDRYENKNEDKYTSDKYDKYGDRYDNKNEDKYTSDKYDKYGDKYDNDKYDNKNEDKYNDKYNDKDDKYEDKEKYEDKYNDKDDEEGDNNDGKLNTLLKSSKTKISIEDILKGKNKIKETFKTTTNTNTNTNTTLNNSPSNNQNINQPINQQVNQNPNTNSNISPNNQNNQTQSNIPPSLSEITSGKVQRDVNGIRDMAYTTKSEDADAVKKRDILFKFKILRKQYKDANIPEYTEFTSLETLQREYESLVRQLALDATVENYKKYLIIGFFGVVYLLYNFLNFTHIQGFAQHQLLGMNQYEALLFQIGEKSYLQPSKQWSPELKLLGLIIINTVVFVGTKLLFKSTGSNLMNLISGGLGNIGSNNTNSKPINVTNATSSTNNSQQAQKGKMRGPSIDIEELTGKKNS